MVTQTQRKPQNPISPPKRATKTAGALSTAHLSLADAKQKRKRTKQGCITCRVRGKKCDETRNDDGTCNTCNRLRIHCLGFIDRRPEWLRTKENIKIWRKRVTDFLLSQGFVKGYAGCGLRSANVPERRLTLQEMRENLSGADGTDEPDDLPVTPGFTAPSHSLPHPSTLTLRDDTPSNSYFGSNPHAAVPPWSHCTHQQLLHYPHSDSESNGTPPQQPTDLLSPDLVYQQHHHQHQHQQQRNPTPNHTLSDIPSPYSSPPYPVYSMPLPPLLSPLPGYVPSGLMSGASMFY